MQVLGQEDDFSPRVSFDRHRSSLSCGVPFSPLLLLDSYSRKSVSYNKLPQEPLNLAVLKLDGSSFDIEVVKTATVAELKQAVEAAFSHLPKKVSWTHLWGHFCLSYDGQKLLTDCDCIGSYGIKEGDKLYFTRHTSIDYNFMRTRSKKKDPHSEQPRKSDPCKERQKNSRHDKCFGEQENLKSQHHDDDGGDVEENGVITRCEYKLAHLLRGWFSYRRLTSPEMIFEEKCSSNSSKLSSGFFGSFGRLYSSKYNYRSGTWK